MPLEFLQQLEQMDRIPPWMEAIYRNKQLAARRSTSPSEAQRFLAASRRAAPRPSISTSVPSAPSFRTSTQVVPTQGKQKYTVEPPPAFKSEEEARKFIEKSRKAMETLSREAGLWQAQIDANEGKRIPTALWALFHRGGFNTRRWRKLVNKPVYRTQIDDRLAGLENAILGHQSNIQAAQAWLDQQAAARAALEQQQQEAGRVGQERLAYLGALNAILQGRKPAPEDVPVPWDPNAMPGQPGNAVPLLNEMLLRGDITKDEYNQLLSGAEKAYGTPAAAWERQFKEQKFSADQYWKAADYALSKQRVDIERARLNIEQRRQALGEEKARRELQDEYLRHLGGNAAAADLVTEFLLNPQVFTPSEDDPPEVRDQKLVQGSAAKFLLAYAEKRKAAAARAQWLSGQMQALRGNLQKSTKVSDRNFYRQQYDRLAQEYDAAMRGANMTVDEFLLSDPQYRPLAANPVIRPLLAQPIATNPKEAAEAAREAHPRGDYTVYFDPTTGKFTIGEAISPRYTPQELMGKSPFYPQQPGIFPMPKPGWQR